ncbi:hypothetical protein [Trueperella pyogenes]|uniref:hypothetical protein n=1 Tax=Trueperella pyogenes TaxID=1661 RepID=UPI00324F137C
MSNDWLPDSKQPTPNRGPLYFFIAAAVLLFVVVLILVFQHMIRSGRDVGTDIKRPTARVTTTATPTTPTAPAAPTTPTPARPAPEGAIEAAAFTTPAQNIHCRINSDNAECSIYVYDYPSPGQCEGVTATYVVHTEGDVDADCRHFVRTPDVFEYGTKIAKNGFACALEQDGVTCWSTKSGRGFELKRAADRIF